MKKTTTFALVIALAFSLLAGCGGNGGGNSNTPTGSTASDSSTSTSPISDSDGNTTQNTIEQRPSRSDFDRVIIDEDGLKVTLTGYESQPDNRWYSGSHIFYFTVENNTDKRIRVQVERMSVNGCMIPPGSIKNSNSLAVFEPGETDEESRTSITNDYLGLCGIATVKDIEFSLQVFDNVDPYLTSETIAIELPADPGFVQTFDVKGIAVVDEQGVKITAIRRTTDEDGIFIPGDGGVLLFVENNSGSDIDVRVDSGYFNGQYISDARIFGDSCSVMNGKAAFCFMSFYKPSLADKGIDTIEEMSMSFTVSEWQWPKQAGGGNSGNPMIRGTELATVSFDAGGNAR